MPKIDWKLGDLVLLAERDEIHAESMDKFLGGTYKISEKLPYGAIRYFLEDVKSETGYSYYFTGEGFQRVDDSDVLINQQEVVMKKLEKKDLKPGDFVIITNKGDHISNRCFEEFKNKVVKVTDHYTIKYPAYLDQEYYQGIIQIEGSSDWIGKNCYEIAMDDDKIEKPKKIKEDVKKLPFKLEEKIICCDAKGKMFLTYGKIYTVKALKEEGDEIGVLVTNDVGYDAGYFAKRFKKATPAIIAKIEAQRIQYEAEAKAAKEAEEKAEAERKAKEFALILVPGWIPIREKLHERDKGAGVCAFAIQWDDGKMDIHAAGPCHAAMGSDNGNPKAQRIAFIESISGRYEDFGSEKGKKEYLRYVDYIVHKGPRKNCFIHEDMDTYLKLGIQLNVERPIEELAGACVSLREGSEFSDKLTLFNKLLDKGYSGNTAYLLSYALDSVLRFQGIDDAHKSLKGTANAEDLLKFFREGYTRTKHLRPYSETKGMYKGIADWASPVGGGESIDLFIKKGLKLVADGGWDAPAKRVTEDSLYAFASVLDKLVN